MPLTVFQPPSGNWHEDRSAPGASTRTDAAAYSKSSAAVGVLSGETSRGPAPRGSRSMVTATNMLALPHSSAASSSSTASSSAAFATRGDTSYVADFGAAAGAARAETEGAPSRRHFAVDRTRRDFMDGEPLDARGGGGGRAGGRGPLTRHAEEAGSVDAPSVWADEYASLRPR